MCLKIHQVKYVVNMNVGYRNCKSRVRMKEEAAVWTRKNKISFGASANETERDDRSPSERHNLYLNNFKNVSVTFIKSWVMHCVTELYYLKVQSKVNL